MGTGSRTLCSPRHCPCLRLPIIRPSPLEGTRQGRLAILGDYITSRTAFLTAWNSDSVRVVTSELLVKYICSSGARSYIDWRGSYFGFFSRFSIEMTYSISFFRGV